MPRENVGQDTPRPTELRKGRASLAQFIRTRREELGLSMLEVSERSDLPLSYISALEAARIGLPTVERRRMLATGLGISNIDLLVAAQEIDRDELPSSANRPRYDAYPHLHEAIDRMSPDAADALQDLIFFVAETPGVARGLNASATRTRWTNELRRLRNQAVHGRNDAVEVHIETELSQEEADALDRGESTGELAARIAGYEDK